MYLHQQNNFSLFSLGFAFTNSPCQVGQVTSSFCICCLIYKMELEDCLNSNGMKALSSVSGTMKGRIVRSLFSIRETWMSRILGQNSPQVDGTLQLAERSHSGAQSLRVGATPESSMRRGAARAGPRAEPGFLTTSRSSSVPGSHDVQAAFVI